MSTQDIILIANGDLRTSANQKCEEAQQAMEALLIKAIEKEGRQERPQLHRQSEVRDGGLP